METGDSGGNDFSRNGSGKVHDGLTGHHVPPTNPDSQPHFLLRVEDKRHAAYHLLFGAAKSFEEAVEILKHDWWTFPAQHYTEEEIKNLPPLVEKKVYKNGSAKWGRKPRVSKTREKRIKRRGREIKRGRFS